MCWLEMQKKRNLKHARGNVEAGNITKGTFETKSGSIRVGDVEDATMQVTSGNIKARKYKKNNSKCKITAELKLKA